MRQREIKKGDLFLVDWLVVATHSGPAEVESNNSLWEGRTLSRDRVKDERAGGQAGQIVRVQVGREHVGCTVAHRCSRERGKAVEQVRRVLARAARVNGSSSRVEYESVGMM